MFAAWSQEVADGLVWARQRLGELGCRVSGTPERVRICPWSAVYTIPISDGVVWFKASGGGTRYEAGLAQALSDWAPDRVMAPLAVDVGRGWQLLPDGGTPLRRLASDRDPRAWERFAVAYAQLQQTVTPYARQMLDLGVPDHRPAAMPALLCALLADPGVVIAKDKRDGIRSVQAAYAEACARLAEAGPPPTIQHDDLHSNNVLPAEHGDRFFDWGDACVAHPFSSLLVALRAMAHTFKLPGGHTVVRRFRDAYLQPWELGRDGPELVELAVWTGTVSRALSWRRALVAAEAAQLAEYNDRVGGWVEELLEPVSV